MFLNLQRLVDMLEEKTHLPAVLQSLGCIAQTAMPVFETREKEIEEFIVEKILKCDNVCLSNSLQLHFVLYFLFYDRMTICFRAYTFQKSGDSKNASWDDKSELCLLKVGQFGEMFVFVYHME